MADSIPHSMMEAQTESPVGVGRGKGKVKKDKGAGKGKSSQEETTDNEESQKSDESGEEETMDTVESEPESVTKPSKGKKKKSGKKSGKYEQDSDFSESDTKTETKKGKGKKGKKKGKKGAVAKESDSDAVKSGTVKKKGKVKGKEESDEDTKAVKGKKKADDDQEESDAKGKKSKKSETVEDDTDGEDESKPVKGKKSKKTENEEDESEEDTKPVKGKKKKAGLKGKKKLKNKKGKKITEKEEETDEESEKKDTAEEEPKTTKAKSPKKLSKKERLKKLKEAKAAKKAKLLEKKKEKLKEAKAKKKKGDTDKDTVSEPESSDVSPAKKKKKGVEKVETSRSPMRKAKAIAESKLESPAQKKKKGKAVGKGGNKRKGDNSELDEIASPAKKAKVGKGAAMKCSDDISTNPWIYGTVSESYNDDIAHMFKESPYEVQITKKSYYDSNLSKVSNCDIAMFKHPDFVDCVFGIHPHGLILEPNTDVQYFSLFRLTEKEAIVLYRALYAMFKVLAPYFGSFSPFEKDLLQNVCDCVQKHPTWTCAHVAGYVGMFQVFKLPLIEREINKADSTGLTPLMAAAIGGPKDCIQEMLRHSKGLPPKMAAALGGQDKCLDEMLRHSAELDRADQNGLTVYHYAVRYNPQVLHFLFEHDKKKVYNWMDEKGHTPLYKACSEPLEENVVQERHVTVEMLLAGGADPSLPNCDKIPIHVAVEKGENRCIYVIIEHDDSQKNARVEKDNNTLLHLAKTGETTGLLCCLGCDLEAKNSDQHTPLQVMMMCGLEECVIELLWYGADCNKVDSNGNTPLHNAVLEDDVQAVLRLIVSKADVNKTTSEGFSARHLAAKSTEVNKDVILHMLHISGAKRCKRSVNSCEKGCSGGDGPGGGGGGGPGPGGDGPGGGGGGGPSPGGDGPGGGGGGGPGPGGDGPGGGGGGGPSPGGDGPGGGGGGGPGPGGDGPGGGGGGGPSPGGDGPGGGGGGGPGPGGDGPGGGGGGVNTVKTKETVLCLDGGGIRGLILIQLLKEIETAAKTIIDKDATINEKEITIKDLFDWIGGTSTGGIIALGIGKGLKLDDIDKLYRKLNCEAFSKWGLTERTNFLEKKLKEVFGEEVMTTITQPRIMVTSTLADRDPPKLHLFRTYIHPTLNEEDDTITILKRPTEQPIWMSARSTSAAPFYFKALGPFIDGGLMANNPTMDVLKEITEIHEFNNHRGENAGREDKLACVISFGCGMIPEMEKKWNDVSWNPLKINKTTKGLKSLLKLLVHQATISDGLPVEHSKMVCNLMKVPFYRFSPQLTEVVSLNCYDKTKLFQMAWETTEFITKKREEGEIDNIAQHLTSAYR